MPHLQIGCKRLFVTDRAPASGQDAKQTLILMHGLGSSQNFYDAIIPELTQQRYRCIAFDHTGSGKSSYTYIEQSKESLAEDALGVLSALGVETAVVVGHSMSGMIAAHLAATSPRVTAAVLIGPVYPSPAVSQAFDKRIATVATDGVEALANTVPATATSKSASPLVRAFIRQLILSSTPEGYISNCRVIANASPPKHGDVKVPTLVLMGDEDTSTPPDMVKKIYNELGTKQGEKKLVIVPECGHWTVLEKPQAVLKEILDFLGGLQASVKL